MEHWEVWESWGADAWVVQVLRYGYRVPFRSRPPLSSVPPPSQLQPQFHQGAGFVGRGVRLGAGGGHRDRASFTGVLQSPLCHPQSYRGLATCHRSLAPQRLGEALPFSHGDCPVCSPVSQARRLDGIPGSPGCLPSGSGASSFSPLLEVLRGGMRLSLTRLLLISLCPLQCSSVSPMFTGLDLLGYSSSPSSVLSTPATVDSATLRSCPTCWRRMSSLTHTSHTFCSPCADDYLLY